MTRIKIQHVTRIKIQHVTRIKIQHVTRIQIQHVTRILILHVKRIDLVHRRMRVKDDEGTEVDINLSRLKETKDRHGINNGGSSNDNMASDLSIPRSYAINDGSSVISNTVIDGVLESALRVTIYYN